MSRNKGHWFIYFIASGEVSRFKCGVTESPKKRLTALRTDSPTSLFLYGFIDVKYQDNAKEVETRIHKLLTPYHHHREWFNLTSESQELISWIVLDGCGIFDPDYENTFSI